MGKHTPMRWKLVWDGKRRIVVKQDYRGGCVIARITLEGSTLEDALQDGQLVKEAPALLDWARRVLKECKYGLGDALTSEGRQIIANATAPVITTPAPEPTL